MLRSGWRRRWRWRLASDAAGLFLVRDGWLVTPSRRSDSPESVTHDMVLVLDGEMGLPVEERPVDRTEIYVAEEAFICGTGREL